MSEKNVEVGEPVRRLFAAFNKRDWGAFSAELDPEVEYAPVEEHATFRGPEAVAQYVERWLEAWDTFSGEAEEVESTPAEDGALIAVRFRGMGKGSGVEIDDRLFWVYELRGGRLYRISEYTDRAEALEAAGLSE
jgi:ketosteroid isomerase-like protein